MQEELNFDPEEWDDLEVDEEDVEEEDFPETEAELMESVKVSDEEAEELDSKCCTIRKEVKICNLHTMYV